ncbi:MAG: histidine kinase [Rhodobacteraceae bacterium]|nr:histidine kinase [Paracoccaceae bacterium]
MTAMADEHLAKPPRDDRKFSLKSLLGAPALTKIIDNFGLSGIRLFRFRSSALARRIITFNLIALCILLMGMLYLNQFKSGLMQERQNSLLIDSSLYVSVVQERIADESVTSAELLANLPVAEGVVARVFLKDSAVASQLAGPWDAAASGDFGITGWLRHSLNWISRLNIRQQTDGPASEIAMATTLANSALAGTDLLRRSATASGETVLAVARPVFSDGNIVAALVLTTQQGYLDQALHGEQETVLRLFLLAVAVSVVLSIVLANTIANPIHDLARAAEVGATKQGRKNAPDRIRIPDLSGRPDEIGRLSKAMRDMTSALFERIDSNEQFAADVAHEIKNPLASLRSAVETLHIAKKEKDRTKLLEVIEHDVRRLDRLVSDISNASRLDAELVKEEEETFDLTVMLDRIVDFHSQEAGEKGIELIWDKPKSPILFDGLEARLAQVFVNLITNAISFCGEGDAVRIWARERDDRVLIVVEDTGPGIPQEALGKVFKRFYSERPEENFGNNSGLGLSISQQIVEAHKGVIWAENIPGNSTDAFAEPLGARFVVGLPV